MTVRPDLLDRLVVYCGTLLLWVLQWGPPPDATVPGRAAVRSAADRPSTPAEDAAAALGPAERARYDEYVARTTAARAASDPEAGWAAGRDYLATTEHEFIRTNLSLRLGRKLAAEGDLAGAAELLERLPLPPRGEPLPPHRSSTVLTLAEWQAGLGRGEDARATLDRLPRPTRDGLGGLMGPTYLARRCMVLAALDDADAARLLYLSGTPPENDPEAVRRYLGAGSVLASAVGRADSPAAELNFRKVLIAKYPLHLVPADLRNARVVARNGGLERDAAALSGLLRDRFPAAFYTANWYDYDHESQKALATGQGVRAAEFSEVLLNHPEASERQRRQARRRLEMLGFTPEGPNAGLVPVPDPAFAPTGGDGG